LENGDHLTKEEFERRYKAMSKSLKAETNCEDGLETVLHSEGGVIALQRKLAQSAWPKCYGISLLGFLDLMQSHPE
jgi:hypothetical protein